MCFLCVFWIVLFILYIVKGYNNLKRASFLSVALIKHHHKNDRKINLKKENGFIKISNKTKKIHSFILLTIKHTLKRKKKIKRKISKIIKIINKNFSYLSITT